ncbi:unnamed protein product [Debaryomyces tyrocola]|nr:unnamed protein product [Debaryomyces tyrocola]
MSPDRNRATLLVFF